MPACSIVLLVGQFAVAAGVEE